MANHLLPSTLQGLEVMLGHIYNEHDRQFYPSVQDMTLVLVWSLGVITEAERKGNTKSLPRFVVNAFSWWIALCNFLHFQAGDILWEKFPGVCPYCLVRVDCSCEGHKLTIVRKSLATFRKKSGRPRTIRGWQRMFARIYGKENEIRGFTFAAGRFPEEVKELIECLLPMIEDRYHLGMELADIGGRLFAIPNLLNFDMEETFLSFYRGVCPGCQREKCGCDPRKR